MTLILHLPQEIEQRLIQEAKQHGLSIDEYTLQLLDRHLPPKERQKELITLASVMDRRRRRRRTTGNR